MPLISLPEVLLPVLSLIFLLPSFVLDTLPIFSAPFTANLSFFGWDYPEGYITTGFVFGLFGGCRLSTNAADRACTTKQYGYTLTMDDVALPSGAGIQGQYTRATAILLPFASIFCLIATIFAAFSIVRAYRISKRRSLPSSQKVGVPKVQVATAIVTLLAFIFATASCGTGFMAYNSARVNINADSGLQMASFRNMFWATVAAAPLLFVTLIIQILGIVRHSRLQSLLRRESTSSIKKVPTLGFNASYDYRPEVDTDRKWTQFVDEDDK